MNDILSYFFFDIKFWQRIYLINAINLLINIRVHTKKHFFSMNDRENQDTKLIHDFYSLHSFISY